MNRAIDRHITERYIDELCRETGATREQAVAAIRRALDLPEPQRLATHLDVPRRHSPGAVLLILTLLGTAWTSAAAAAFALIWGWRPL